MATPLNYAPPPPWHERRRWRRTVIAFLFLGATTLACVWAWRLSEQIRYVHAWRGQFGNALSATQPLVAHASSSWSFPPSIYAHIARSHDGSPRFLEVRADTSIAEDSIKLYACVSTVPTWEIGSRSTVLGEWALTVDADHLNAGQPDPSDGSHFTIRYESNGQSGLIDGWLMPDDTVKLEPRGGPLRY